MIAKPETLNEVVSAQSQTTGVIREIQDIERDLTLSVIRKNDFPENVFREIEINCFINP